MGVVLDFSQRMDKLIKDKLKRFEELKPRSHSETLNPNEIIEFDSLYNWLQIHKNKVNKLI